MEQKTGNLVLCGLFAALMAVGAFLHIMLPIGPFQVTISLQIFFAILAGLFLGPKHGFLSVLAYLVLGLAGVPVFARGGGLGYVLKPTFGFLLGFPCAAWAAGMPGGSVWKAGLKQQLLAAFGGEMGYYAAGLVYYYVMFNFVLQNAAGMGIIRLLEVWFFSTVIPDSILCVLAVLVYRKLGPLVRR